MIHSQQCFSFSFSIDDDNFFHHLRSIHKCAIKYVQKYFLNARGQPRKWLLALFYGVLLQLQLLPVAARVARAAAVAVDVVLPLPMLCTVASSIMLIKAQKKG